MHGTPFPQDQVPFRGGAGAPQEQEEMLLLGDHTSPQAPPASFGATPWTPPAPAPSLQERWRSLPLRQKVIVASCAGVALLTFAGGSGLHEDTPPPAVVQEAPPPPAAPVAPPAQEDPAPQEDPYAAANDPLEAEDLGRAAGSASKKAWEGSKTFVKGFVEGLQEGEDPSGDGRP